MLFVAICTDKPGMRETRAAVRAKHLAWLAAQGGRVRLAGPMQDADGQPLGSLFLWEGESRDAVEALVAQDPYVTAGLFESVVLRPFRIVIEAGRHVGH